MYSGSLETTTFGECVTPAYSNGTSKEGTTTSETNGRAFQQVPLLYRLLTSLCKVLKQSESD